MISIKKEPRRELRCSKCRALCGYENLYLGSFSFKCKRCNEITTVFFHTPIKLILQLIKEDKELAGEWAKIKNVLLSQEGGQDATPKE